MFAMQPRMPVAVEHNYIACVCQQSFIIGGSIYLNDILGGYEQLNI